jgi:hypothetical protein
VNLRTPAASSTKQLRPGGQQGQAATALLKNPSVPSIGGVIPANSPGWPPDSPDATFEGCGSAWASPVTDAVTTARTAADGAVRPGKPGHTGLTGRSELHRCWGFSMAAPAHGGLRAPADLVRCWRCGHASMA